jgi:hypothetical protein
MRAKGGCRGDADGRPPENENGRSQTTVSPPPKTLDDLWISKLNSSLAGIAKLPGAKFEGHVVEFTRLAFALEKAKRIVEAAPAIEAKPIAEGSAVGPHSGQPVGLPE